MHEKTIFKVIEVEGKTRYTLNEILEIVKLFISNMNIQYDIETENILYDNNFYITDEPVWYVDIIARKIKAIWPDAFETMVISDLNGKVIYILNDHGVAHKI